VPAAYINPPGAFRDEFEVPPPPGRVALPPVELGRAAPPLKGVVRDATGAPVAGATVGGHWYATFEAGGAIQAGIQATTDDRGRFEVARIAPDAKVTLTAQKGDLATAAPVEARGGQPGAVALTVRAGRTVAVAGRVVDASGKPLAGAAVRFNAQERPKGVNFQNWRQLSVDSGNWLYTKADGTFETPRQTRAEGLEFQAEAVANGYVQVQTPWTPVGDGDVLRLPDIPLRREAGARVVVGRVVDSKGAPVAGARVLQRGEGPRPTEALADADGRFRLPGVAGGRALVCARAEGFRDGGAIAGPEGSVEIRLARDGEAVRPLARAPEPLTRAEERKLGLSLLEPVRRPEKAAALEAAAHRGEAGPLFARLDPDRAVELLEDRTLQNPVGSLIQVAMARLEDDSAAALAVLDADRSGLARARGLCPLADLADAIAPRRRAEILDRAAAAARRLESAEEKLILIGEVADRWLESFDLDRAAPILREGQKALAAAKPELFAYQAAPFGEALAAIDLPAAEAFLARKAPGGSKGADIDMRDRAAVAVRLAVADPKAAERQARMLKQVPNFYDPQAYLLRIARNMARADLPRARAVLDLLDDPKARVNLGKGPLKPYGLALLAEARADVDPEGARALLDEAFAGLRALAEAQPGQVTYPSIDEVMAGLLPLVERLQPDRMAERLWLAVACRANRTEPLEGHRAADMLVLALLVSRYDREMAAVIAEPVTAALPELASQSNGGGMPFYRSPGNPFHVLAALDPRALVAFIGRLPESARVTRDNGQGPTLSVEDRARWAGAEMLGMPPEARRRAAIEGPFDAWPVRGHMRYRRVLQ
jgi:hypothetical protein